MTIASLFVQLGFSVKNPGAINDAEKSLVKASHSATRAAVAIDAMNAALFLLLETSAKVGVALKEFQIRTGLSATSLQEWEQQAAASNVSGDELVQSIKEIQNARTDFAKGLPKALGAWSLLGVDPRQDPFVVLDKLRGRLKDYADVGLARSIANDAGLGEGMFQLLRQPRAPVDQNLILNQQQIDALFRLKTAWNSFSLAIGSAKTQLGAALAPAVTSLIKALTLLSSALAGLTKWLSGTGPAARNARVFLGFLAAGIVLLGVAVTGLAGALSLAAAAGALFTVIMTPLGLGVALISAEILVLVVALGAIVLIFQDLYTASNGGKSFFKWDPLILKSFDTFAQNLAKILDLMEKISYYWDKFSKPPAFLKTLESNGPIQWSRIAPGLIPNTTVNQDVDIHVNGAQSPAATGKQVGTHLQTQLNEAYRQGASDRW